MTTEIKLAILLHLDLISVFVWTLGNSGSKQMIFFIVLPSGQGTLVAFQAYGGGPITKIFIIKDVLCSS